MQKARGSAPGSSPWPVDPRIPFSLNPHRVTGLIQRSLRNPAPLRPRGIRGPGFVTPQPHPRSPRSSRAQSPSSYPSLKVGWINCLKAGLFVQSLLFSRHSSLKAGLKSVSLSRDQHRPQMLLVPSVLPHRFHQGALHPTGRNKVSLNIIFNNCFLVDNIYTGLIQKLKQRQSKSLWQPCLQAPGSNPHIPAR